MSDNTALSDTDSRGSVTSGRAEGKRIRTSGFAALLSATETDTPAAGGPITLGAEQPRSQQGEISR